MELYPAIDLRGGLAVRLVQGDYSRETVYGGDPLAVAKEFEGDGARWLHVVDLDAARTGRPENRAVVARIVGAVDVPVQVGGGIRDEFSAEALLEDGVARVVVGTAAVEQPSMVRRLGTRHPGRVAASLDSRSGEVAVRGWSETTGMRVEHLVETLEDAGLAALVVTEISRDGTMAGPDLSGLAAVLAATSVPVIASGGVGSIQDLRDLARLQSGGRRLAGVIVGKAIHDGDLTLEEAMAACDRSG
jgi:phosphoribosylformimino-5-aminoimidazole carboxamide ribotide isomerase